MRETPEEEDGIQGRNKSLEGCRGQGIMKQWDEGNRFGFAAVVGGGEDIFVHQDELPDGRRYLEIREAFEFTYKINHQKGKWQATEVTLEGVAAGVAPEEVPVFLLPPEAVDDTDKFSDLQANPSLPAEWTREPESWHSDWVEQGVAPKGGEGVFEGRRAHFTAPELFLSKRQFFRAFRAQGYGEDWIMGEWSSLRKSRAFGAPFARDD